ncbi:oxoacyl-ACP reductase, putative [Eimeria maxima]|uniref:3-oxoacyl-[acyl-carrier-protein] reductase n=1 Tax=Eimeria maxima TaxID=5804 RepID=U6M1K4_EIMMA|nr:oxoacyl-ACP reductase, putative [Eimeria maxima]CDJ56973.1 oxoacyl-ACP reductase, putative [Eimeria maxima]
MSSVVGIGGNKGQVNYSASKGGLISFSKSLSKEYSSRNITINAIAPGFIQSNMTDKMTPEAKAGTLSTIPAGRLGTPQEVANLAAFLASDQASYITGKVIPIDGGMLFGSN